MDAKDLLPARRRATRGWIVSIALGLIVGGVVPLNSKFTTDRGMPQSASSARAHSETAAPGVPEEFQAPATPTPEWAAECAVTRPQAFLRWMLKQDPQPAGELVEAFFTAWIGKDCDAAFTAGLKLPLRFGYGARGEFENRFFGNQLKELFSRDPGAALRWAGKIEGVIGCALTNGFGDQAFDYFATVDPAQMTRWAQENPQVWMVGEAMFSNYGRYLAEKKGLPEAVAWMQTLNMERQGAVLKEISLEWGKRDPEGALKFLETAPSVLRQNANYLLCSAFRSNERAGMEWLADNFGSTSNDAIGLMNQLVYRSREEALQAVMEMEPGRNRAQALRTLGQGCCLATDSSSAVKWLTDLSPELMPEALHGALNLRWDQDVMAFLTPLGDGSLAPGIQESFLKLVATEVPQLHSDSQLALLGDWLKNHPGEMADQFVRQADQGKWWLPQHRQKFLSILPPGDAERLLGSASPSISGDDFHEAVNPPAPGK